MTCGLQSLSRVSWSMVAAVFAILAFGIPKIMELAQ
jgi:hypothetical protein